jgi:hypothetical protein
MPGTSWLRDTRFSAFRPGIHRAHRFLHGAWLTPLEAGYSRAIPLRFLPAFPPKAIPADVPAQREWEAGSLFINWLRRRLDRVGCSAQKILVTRTARNRSAACITYQNLMSLVRDVPPVMENVLSTRQIGYSRTASLAQPVR